MESIIIPNETKGYFWKDFVSDVAGKQLKLFEPKMVNFIIEKLNKVFTIIYKGNGLYIKKLCAKHPLDQTETITDIMNISWEYQTLPDNYVFTGVSKEVKEGNFYFNSDLVLKKMDLKTFVSKYQSQLITFNTLEELEDEENVPKIDIEETLCDNDDLENITKVLKKCLY